MSPSFLTMANVTDPLARSVHGKDPQNLIEYITRQKIYDSIYWKEECFGLSASDVATKAVDLKALGGSYGANNKPTRFLCLALKLLQIQPEEGIVDEFLMNEDFKYVRALGAFYLRLTGRPAEIYEQIEPLYNDFRKLRFRTPTGWVITHVDEFADELLTSDRYCGIALPHLPKREVLVSAGYLDGPRRSALTPLIEEQSGGDAEKLLEKLAQDGNAAALLAMSERKKRKRKAEEEERSFREQQVVKGGDSTSSSRRHHDDEPDRFYRHQSDDRVGRQYRGGFGRDRDEDDYYRDHSRSGGTDLKPKKEKKSSNDDKKYGSLFKKSSSRTEKQGGYKGADSKAIDDGGDGNVVIEGSEDYWDAERAKLGLKPLKKD
ncbi:hypothetical protein ACHAWC_009334 [Mediolabrus comicus]